MKCIKANLPKNLKQIKLEVFCDLHIGSTKTDYKLIQERINRVKREKDVYALLIGDLINNSTKTSVGDVYSESLSPLDQMKYAVGLFEPIKHKILAITSGNHERRSYKTEGIDLSWFLARELGLEDKYDYSACLVFIRFGEMSGHMSHKPFCYVVYASHGDKIGGRLPGSKANGLQRKAQIVNADVFCIGHSHQPLSFRDSCFEINYGTSSVKQKDRLFVNLAASLNYEEYAELSNLPPSSKKNPLIILHGDLGDEKLAEVVL